MTVKNSRGPNGGGSPPPIGAGDDPVGDVTIFNGLHTEETARLRRCLRINHQPAARTYWPKPEPDKPANSFDDLSAVALASNRSDLIEKNNL